MPRASTADELLIEYPLPAPVGVRLDALGSIESTTIASRPARIHLPVLQNGNEPALNRPAVVEGLADPERFSVDFEDGLVDSPWGYPTSWGSTYDKTELAVARIVIAFDVDTDEADLAHFRSLPASAAAWFASVRDWCEVLAHQDLDHQSPRQRTRLEGDGWTAWRRSEQVPVRGRFHFDFDHGQALTASGWTEIVGLVEAVSPPPLTALLLRDARNADVRGYFRRAVLDASTALEIALHGLLVDLQEAAPSPLAAELVRSADRWTLGRLLETVRNLEALPDTVTSDLVRLRNQVVHKTAHDPSSDESKAMIRAATDCCVARSPSWPRHTSAGP
jgi:hypothetical protein